MRLRLVQFRATDGSRRIAAADTDGRAERLEGVSTTCQLVQIALETDTELAATVAARLSGHWSTSNWPNGTAGCWHPSTTRILPISC